MRSGVSSASFREGPSRTFRDGRDPEDGVKGREDLTREGLDGRVPVLVGGGHLVDRAGGVTAGRRSFERDFVSGGLGHDFELPVLSNPFDDDLDWVIVIPGGSAKFTGGRGDREIDDRSLLNSDWLRVVAPRIDPWEEKTRSGKKGQDDS